VVGHHVSEPSDFGRFDGPIVGLVVRVTDRRPGPKKNRHERDSESLQMERESPLRRRFSS